MLFRSVIMNILMRSATRVIYRNRTMTNNRSSFATRFSERDAAAV